MRVAIVTSGPSLFVPDVEKIRGKMDLIAVKDTYTLFPWAKHIFGVDRGWWQRNAGPAHRTGATLWSCPGNDRLMKELGINVMPATRAVTSGHYGPYLAHHLGYTEMFLFGFTFGSHNNKPHFFKDDDVIRDYPGWRKNFLVDIAMLSSKGIIFHDCTDGTNTQLPFESIDNYIEGKHGAP